MHFRITLTLLCTICSCFAGNVFPTSLPSNLGVNIHFTHPRAGEMKMLAAGGFRVARMDFDWRRIEKEKGVYDFKEYEDLIRSLEAAGVRPYIILDYTNPLYDDNQSPHTDAGRAAFAKWAAESVTHFKGHHIIWEMYNEPNIPPFWRPTPNFQDYIKLALAVGKAVRDAAPDETFIGPACSRIDFPLLEDCFKAGLLEYFSAVSVHPYRQDAPESVENDYRALRLLIAQYAPKGKTIPIISGEWGYSSAWSSFDPDKQGRFLPRQWLTNISNGIPLSIWYDWHDDGPDPKEPEHHFGTVLYDYHQNQDPVYTPKPAYRAAKTLTSMLDGFTFNKRLIGSVAYDADHILIFNKGTDVRLVAWSTADRTHDTTIPAAEGAKFTVYNYLGEKVNTLEADEKGFTVSLSDSPVYIVPDKPDEVLVALTGWERIPLEFVGNSHELNRFTMAFHNSLDHRVRISSVSAGASATQWVRAGQTVRIRFRASLLRDPHPLPLPIFFKIGDSVDVAQVARFIVTNPLIATVSPVGDKLYVRIANPTGEPFTGSVVAKVQLNQQTSEQSSSQPIQIAQDQKETSIAFVLAPAVPVSVDIVDNQRHSFAVTPKLRYAPISLDPQDLEIRAEGDKKVASTQSIGAAPAPEDSPIPFANTLKISYDFGAGWKYVCVRPKDQASTLPGTPHAAAMWVRGDGSGNFPRLRFVDATGQTFQTHGPRLTDKQWHYLEFRLDGTGAGHWGGANDGTIHYPIHIETIFLLDNARRAKIGGEVLLAAPTVIYAD